MENFYFRSRKMKNLKRLLSIFTASFFLLNGVAFSTPIGSDSTYQPLNTNLSFNSERIKNLFIPENYGSIVKKWDSGQSGKFIIYIQDAHCHYEAQHNIAKILEVLIRDYGVDLVAVEGAKGDLNLSRYGNYKDEKAKEKAVDTYVKKGYVTGPEYLNITKYNKLPFGIYGVEDGQLYVENFISFRETWANVKETEFFIKEIVRITRKLKEKIYSKELLDFDRKHLAYEENELSLTEWINHLRKQKPRASSTTSKLDQKNLCVVIKSIELEEQIDFKKVERERKELIKGLEKSLVKEELEQLVKKSLLFRLGKVSSLEYYSYLGKYLSLAKDLSNFVNLEKYIELIKLQAQIDSDELFNEIDLIVNNIKEGLFQNEYERKLDALSYNIGILKRLFHLQLKRKELEYFENHRQEFRAESLLSFIIIQATINNMEIPSVLEDSNFLKKVDNCILPANEFYKAAIKRDKALVNNTLSKMGKEGKDKAVMVTGGFHTKGIIKLLTDKDINYIVITPKITKQQIDNPYLSIMLNKNVTFNTLQDKLAVIEMLAEDNKLREHIGGLERIGEKVLELIEQLSSGTITREEAAEKIWEMNINNEEKEMIRKIVSQIEGPHAEAIIEFMNDIFELNRKGHDEYHEQGNFDKVISLIAEELGIEPNENGEYDFGFVKEKSRVETSHGELRFEDGILIIIDSRFNKNHTGRRRFTVYANTPAKAVHEITELKTWINYAISELGFTESDIRKGKLNQWIKDHIKGAKELRDAFHGKAIKAEAEYLLKNDPKYREIGVNRIEDDLKAKDDRTEFYDLTKEDLDITIAGAWDVGRGEIIKLGERLDRKREITVEYTGPIEVKIGYERLIIINRHNKPEGVFDDIDWDQVEFLVYNKEDTSEIKGFRDGDTLIFGKTNHYDRFNGLRQDETVSRKHVSIYRSGNHITITDLDSTNGTVVEYIGIRDASSAEIDRAGEPEVDQEGVGVPSAEVLKEIVDKLLEDIEKLLAGQNGNIFMRKLNPGIIGKLYPRIFSIAMPVVADDVSLARVVVRYLRTDKMNNQADELERAISEWDPRYFHLEMNTEGLSSETIAMASLLWKESSHLEDKERIRFIQDALEEFRNVYFGVTESLVMPDASDPGVVSHIDSFVDVKLGQAEFEDLPRYVICGDIHGELDGFRENLRQANLIDENDDWIGGNNVLLQAGDVIDRGPKSRESYELLEKLQEQARDQGGDVIRLLGNHELMLIQGNYGYANFKNCKELAQKIKEDILNKKVQAAHVVGDRIVVHGGMRTKIRELLKNEAAKKKGVSVNEVTLQDIADRCNELLIEAVEKNDFKHAIFQADRARGGHADVAGIFWCDFFDIMKSMHARDIPQILAHTPERISGANIRFTDSLGAINVDVGLFDAYGGNNAFLVIENGKFKRSAKNRDGIWEVEIIGDISMGTEAEDDGEIRQTTDEGEQIGLGVFNLDGVPVAENVFIGKDNPNSKAEGLLGEISSLAETNELLAQLLGLFDEFEKVDGIRNAVKEKAGGIYQDIRQIYDLVDEVLLDKAGLKYDKLLSNLLAQLDYDMKRYAPIYMLIHDLLFIQFFPNDVPVYRSVARGYAGLPGTMGVNSSQWAVGEKGLNNAIRYKGSDGSGGDLIIIRAEIGKLREKGVIRPDNIAASDNAIELIHRNKDGRAERVEFEIVEEKGDPVPGNIGKDVDFQVIDDNTIEINGQRISTKDEKLEAKRAESIIALAKTLNLANAHSDFIAKLERGDIKIDNIKVYKGTTLSRAAGAFGHMENGTLYVDEVLFNSKAGNMAIIHEAMHYYSDTVDTSYIEGKIREIGMDWIIKKAEETARGEENYDSAYHTYLRHYYARFYLQNPIRGRYRWSLNRRLTRLIHRSIYDAKKELLFSSRRRFLAAGVAGGVTLTGTLFSSNLAIAGELLDLVKEIVEEEGGIDSRIKELALKMVGLIEAEVNRRGFKMYLPNKTILFPFIKYYRSKYKKEEKILTDVARKLQSWEVDMLLFFYEMFDEFDAKEVLYYLENGKFDEVIAMNMFSRMVLRFQYEIFGDRVGSQYVGPWKKIAEEGGEYSFAPYKVRSKKDYEPDPERPYGFVNRMAMQDDALDRRETYVFMRFYPDRLSAIMANDKVVAKKVKFLEECLEKLKRYVEKRKKEWNEEIAPKGSKQKSDNIGKEVVFVISGDGLTINGPDGDGLATFTNEEINDVDIGERSEEIKKLARTLNIYHVFEENFIDVLDGLIKREIKVYKGTPESRAAGAFGHMKDGILYLDEVLINNDMVIIHELIHAYLINIPLEELEAAVDIIPDDHIKKKIKTKVKLFEHDGKQYSSYLRHYYARYYLQNLKDGKYEGSANQQLTYTIRLHATANLFGIPEDRIEEFDRLLKGLDSQDKSEELRNTLLKLMKENDGEITSDEVELLVSNMGLVVKIIDALTIGESPLIPEREESKREAIKRISLYLSIYGMGRELLPGCMGNLLNALEIDDSYRKEARNMLMELRKKDIGISNIFLDEIVELYEVRFGSAQKIKNAVSDVRMYLSFLHKIRQRLKMKDKDIQTITLTTDIGRVVKEYLNREKTENRSIIVDILARHLLEEDIADGEETESRILTIIGRKGLKDLEASPEDRNKFREFRKHIEDELGKEKERLIKDIRELAIDEPVFHQHLSIYVGDGDKENADWYVSKIDGVIVDIIGKLTEGGCPQVFSYDNDNQRQLFERILKNRASQMGIDAGRVLEKMVFVDISDRSEFDTYNKIKEAIVDKVSGRFAARGFTTDYIHKNLISVAPQENRFEKERDKRKDKIIMVGEREEVDLYMLWMIALRYSRAKINNQGEIIDETFWSDIERFFTLYYKNTDVLVKDALKAMKEKGLCIILPPVSPFVREYYNALKGAREVIRHAA